MAKIFYPVRILDYSGFFPTWGIYPPNVLETDFGMVGGGEAAYLQTAVGMSRLGHDVVCCHPGQRGVWKGVSFHTKHDFEALARNERWDAVISWSDQRALHSPGVSDETAKIFPQQLNDLNMGVWRLDAIVSPSYSHANHLKSLLRPEWPMPKFFVAYSGVTCEYRTAWRWPRDRIVGYWSSPDRGLLHVLRIWPRVKKEVPDAKLWIFYEVSNWLRAAAETYGAATPENMSAWYRMQAELVKQHLLETSHLDVKLFGAMPRRKLAEYQQRVSVFCYPCDNGASYVEGFAVAVLEALAAGCWPILSPTDALPEIYAAANCDWVQRGNEDALLETLVERLVHPQDGNKLISNINLAKGYSWETASAQLAGAVEETVRRKKQGQLS